MSGPQRPRRPAGPVRGPHPAARRPQRPEPDDVYPEAAPTGPNPVRADLRADDDAERPARPGGRVGKPGKGKSGKNRKGKRSRLFFGLAAGALALAVVALIAVVAMWPDPPKADPADPGSVKLGRPEESGYAPSTYSSSPSTDVFQAIADRKDDKKPLTADEMFPKGSLDDDTTGAALTRRSSVLDADCAKAIWGQGLADALGKAGCTQAVRGVYTDQKKGFAAVVAVYNVKTAEAADDVVEAFGAGSGGFIRLPAGVPDLFGQGFSLGRGIAMGHYALVAWVQRFDGTGDERSAPLLSILVTAAEADALYSRAAG